MSQLAYRRVLLKLSGEALMGDEDYGIDPKVISRLAREVIEAQQAGAEIGAGDRRRQHLPRRRPGRRRHGPGHRRPDGHAGHGDQRAGDAGRAGEARRQVPGDERDQDQRRVRGLHPPPRRAPPGEGPHRDLRRRHRQSVLHHRLGRGAARDRDRRRPAAEGDQGRRRLRQGPEEARRRGALRAADLRRSHRPRPAGHGHRRLRPVPRQRPAAAHLRHEPAGRCCCGSCAARTSARWCRAATEPECAFAAQRSAASRRNSVAARPRDRHRAMPAIDVTTTTHAPRP